MSDTPDRREIAAPDPTLISVQSGTIQYRWLAGSWVMEDHAYDSKEMVFGQTVELLDEIRRLRCRIDDMEATIDRLSVTWELP